MTTKEKSLAGLIAVAMVFVGGAGIISLVNSYEAQEIAKKKPGVKKPVKKPRGYYARDLEFDRRGNLLPLRPER